jgi:hypothetical protein
MNDYSANLERLLKSKSRRAQMFGLAAALLTFVPTACQVFGDDSLTGWQKGERLSGAAINMLILIGAGAINPESLTDEEKPPD